MMSDIKNSELAIGFTVALSYVIRGLLYFTNLLEHYLPIIISRITLFINNILKYDNMVLSDQNVQDMLLILFGTWLACKTVSTFLKFLFRLCKCRLC